MSYTAKEKDFIKYVKNRCKEHGVQCKLSNTKTVKLQEGLRCSGYFDETVPLLICSMDRDDWIGILAHEYSHLTQWVEQIPLWIEATTSLSHVWEWLDGVDKDDEDMDHHFQVAIDLELDNEKRTVNVMQRFDLNVDIEAYIKGANSYLLFYNYLKQSRRWSRPGRAPYNNSRLVDAMSPKFNMNYTKLSKKVEKIFREENI